MTDGTIVAFGTFGTPAPEPGPGLWLRPFSGLPKVYCPKCLSEAVASEHHTTTVVGMCKEARDAVLALTDTPELVPDEMTEHLCRGCFTCHFNWSERVAGPAEMRLLKELTSGTSE
ncbi:hypothetical protein E6R60_26295 [Streptomyces sp. A0642]|uniref:hypothetical protein n=1 Tax=Streptomyces sp. A0642 TaxID=2563100 RepID=UPI0010A22D62|nr:hypothetical protein [Streptomyces sp. A0642]THA72446.1 hypothetical protein E6R60_26295 [Streptomyces sp. A0642]